jgi:diguanylate cyclase (GGDEF)-like protein/PAS domain S-box-containing protein
VTQTVDSLPTAQSIAPTPLVRVVGSDDRRLRTGVWVGILTIAYGLTSWVGLQSASMPTHTSVVWPSAALALAACLAWGPRAWAGVWVIASLISLWASATPSGIPRSAVLLALSISFGTTLQAIVTAELIKQRAGGGLFTQAGGVARFLGVAAIGCVIAPSWTAITLLLTGQASVGTYLESWLAWYLGDLTSVLVFAPLLLQWREMLRVSRRKGWIAEAIGTCVAVIALSAIVYFGWQSLRNPQYLLAFIALPCIVWIAFRFRPPGVALTAAFVSAMASGAMSHGSSTFASDISQESFLLFQAFSALVSITGLALAAAITGQKRAEKAVRAEKAEYLDLYDNAPDMFASVDGTTRRVIECNQTLASALGYTKDEIIGRDASELYHPDSRDAALMAFMLFQRTGAVTGMELMLQRKNGSKLDVSLTASAVRDAEGRVIRSRSAWHDITASKIAERTLQDSQQLWRAFIEQAPAAIAMFDLEMRYLAVSRRFLADAGFPPETELYGASHYKVFPTMPEHWKEAHKRALAGEVVTGDDDRFETQDGRVQWLHWEVRPWFDVNGLAGVVVYTEDVTRRKQASDALRKLNVQLEERVRERTAQLEELAREMEERSLTDQLTGLANRRSLDLKLAMEVRLAVRHMVPLSFVMLDVDHFKQYNDSFGHPAGDDVLRKVAAILQECVRVTDFAARWGGEEFAVMLRHTSEDGALIVAERIRESVERTAFTHRRVTVSVGVATLMRFKPNAGDLLAEADRALYEAKRGGRNRVVTASHLSPSEDHGQNQKSA